MNTVVIDQWLDKIRVSPATKKRYKETLCLYQNSEGHLPTSGSEAQEYLRKREQAGKSPSTVMVTATALKRYMTWANVPCEKFERPPIALSEPEYLSPEEVKTLLEACNSPIMKCLTTLLYDTGARIGEILGLKLTDIDLKGFLTVTRKGGKRERVPVTEFGLKQLTSFLQYRAAWHNENLFGDWQYIDVWKEYRRICIEAGIKKFHPHMLRHSRAIDMRNQGVDWDIIAYQLGHVNPTLTMKIYTRLTPEDLRKQVPIPKIGG